MRLSALIFCCLLVGCSQATSVMLPQPSKSTTVVDPHTVGVWTMYTLQIPIGFDLVAGHDGFLYGYGYNGGWDELVKMDSQGNETPIPLPGLNCPTSESITPNPDGNIYAADALQDGTPAIAQVTPQGTTTQFPLPYTDCTLGMVSGSDGHLWIVHTGGIGRMTTNGQYTEFGGGPFAFPRIQRGGDKNLWVENFTHSNGANTLVRISVQDGSQTTFPCPSDADDLTEGPSNNLYMMGEGQIYQVNMDGTVTAYPLANATIRNVMTLGTKGRLFWAHDNNHVIFYKTDTHEIKKRVAAPYGSNILSVSPDRTKLWFIGSATSAEALTL